MNFNELSEEEKALINSFREQKKIFIIENKVNDNNEGYYDIEKIVLKYIGDKSIEVATSNSSYSDFDYKLGKRTGIYTKSGSCGFFRTILNEEQIINLKKFFDEFILE